MLFNSWLNNRKIDSKRTRAKAARRVKAYQPRLESLEDRFLLSTFTVINTGDSGAGSLRQAIADANATANTDSDGDGTIDPDRIEFNIAGSGVQTITPRLALPAITDPVVIDGYSQPGASPNTLPSGNNAVLLVELFGGQARFADGLRISAGSSIVQGLVINRFERSGILVTGDGNTIAGNFIGTKVDGTTALGNRRFGVLINAASNNNIGGTAPEARNIIAFNVGDGIALAGGSNTGNALLSNSIFANFGLGMDLQNDGVTANDLGDGDTGPNNLENFPVLSSTVSTTTETTIEGTLNSNPNQTYRIEFFANVVGDVSGFGEGERFLGFVEVITDGDGNASFSATFPTAVPGGHFVTATATLLADHDANSDTPLVARETSEFSGGLLTEQVLNQAPIAEAGLDQTAEEGTTIDFDGLASSDPDGDALAYSWDFGDGEGTTGATPTHAYADNGTYTVVLTVEDGRGLAHSDTLTVTVNNVAPTATLSNNGPVNEGSPVTVSFANQFDPSSADTAAGFLYSYDFNNDGDFSDAGELENVTDTATSFAFADNGAYIVRARIQDKDGSFTDYTTSVTVNNVAPTAAIAGATTGSEGTAVGLTSSVNDPSPVDQAAGFIYAWTVSRSRDSGATFAAYAAATTADYTLAPDDGLYRVTLTATDKDGAASAVVSHDVTIVNLAPAASITGPDGGVRGQTRTFTLAAADASPLDQAAGFIFRVDWESDGIIDETVTGLSGTQVSHVYQETGTYTVRVTATDKDDAQSAAATHGIAIAVVALQDDDCHLGHTALAVGGTTGDDQIHFGPGPNAGEIEVQLNGASLGVFSLTGRLLAFGQAGDDNLQVAGSIALSAWLYGGDGNDRTKGGAGHDVLLGETGDDLLVGGNGRDLLVGGAGADRLVGNADDDILVAGSLGFADLDAALCAIMAEWTSARDYETRFNNISGSGTGDRANGNYFLWAKDDTTGTLATERSVFDDDAKDVLTGSAGLDWFFFDQNLDRATDLSDEVFANDLEFILS